MLREYEALRAEIGLYHQQQNQSLNFAMLGTIAAIPAFHTLTIPDSLHMDFPQRILLLGLPLFVMINGIAFADRSLRVKRIARYLHSCLRPKLIARVGSHDIWHWEIFKKASHAGTTGRNRVLSLVMDNFRLAFFWLVSGSSFFLYCHNAGWLFFGHTVLEKIFLGFNFLFILVFLLASLEIEETTGAIDENNQNGNGESR